MHFGMVPGQADNHLNVVRRNRWSLSIYMHHGARRRSVNSIFLQDCFK